MRITKMAPAMIWAVFLSLQTVHLFGLGEEKLYLGGKAGWEQIEIRQGIHEIGGTRPHNVLALSSSGEVENHTRANVYFSSSSGTGGLAYQRRTDGASSGAGTVDLALSFDEASAARFVDSAGRYRLEAGGRLLPAKQGWARKGAGAAFFPGASNVPIGNASAADACLLRLYPASPDALFSAGRRLEDFSVEFWLYPVTMENGEQMFHWTAAISSVGTQTITCKAYKNRLQWSFDHFFASPQTAYRTGAQGGGAYLNVTLAAKTPLAPKTWSLHSIRFNAGRGQLEYYVNGNLEDIVYTTTSRSERGEIYTPLVGERGSLILGERFNGMIDEFFIKEGAEYSEVSGPFNSKGVMQTKSVKISTWESTVSHIMASGGRGKMTGGKFNGEYIKDRRFRFADNSEIQFFVRTSNSAYQIENTEWRSFVPGEELHGLRGRFVQIMADFYPSGDNETSPYLESLEIIYTPSAPPPPPMNLVAIARDGAVELRWKSVSAQNLGGFLVYYGTQSGEYLGEGALPGISPIDVGLTTSVRLDNLKNGLLYFFSVSAYDNSGVPRELNGVTAGLNQGEFSKEVTARPLRMESDD
ncbi:MAG: hypothetical protein LBD20_07450 [Spirochaetaceae bacterium]|nr:hypothetical protein [Spirochaetaceae bacterium]